MATIAKKPRTTMTAIAQCGKAELPEADCTLPEPSVADVVEADWDREAETDDAVRAEAEAEAEAADADAAAASDAETDAREADDEDAAAAAEVEAMEAITESANVVSRME